MARTSAVVALLVSLFLGLPLFADDAAPERKFEGRTSGFEGREDLLGKNMAVVLKTMQDSQPYQHEINDALIKATLGQLQFAKDHDMLDELLAQDLKVTSPMLERTAKLINRTENPELALVAVFDRTTCHYQLVLETESQPGKRTFQSPFNPVLDITRRLGQYDLTEKWIHENWTVPRYHQYAKVMGVEFDVSPWNEDRTITVSLAN